MSDVTLIEELTKLERDHDILGVRFSVKDPEVVLRTEHVVEHVRDAVQSTVRLLEEHQSSG